MTCHNPTTKLNQGRRSKLRAAVLLATLTALSGSVALSQDLTRSQAKTILSNQPRFKMRYGSADWRTGAYEELVRRGITNRKEMPIGVSRIESSKASFVSATTLVVDDITGITDAPIFGGKIAEFRCSLIGVPKGIVRLVATQCTGAATFRKYDDGWRFQEIVQLTFDYSVLPISPADAKLIAADIVNEDERIRAIKQHQAEEAGKLQRQREIEARETERRRKEEETIARVQKEDAALTAERQKILREQVAIEAKKKTEDLLAYELVFSRKPGDLSVGRQQDNGEISYSLVGGGTIATVKGVLNDVSLSVIGFNGPKQFWFGCIESFIRSTIKVYPNRGQEQVFPLFIFKKYFQECYSADSSIYIIFPDQDSLIRFEGAFLPAMEKFNRKFNFDVLNGHPPLLERIIADAKNPVRPIYEFAPNTPSPRRYRYVKTEFHAATQTSRERYMFVDVTNGSVTDVDIRAEGGTSAQIWFGCIGSYEESEMTIEVAGSTKTLPTVTFQSSPKWGCPKLRPAVFYSQEDRHRFLEVFQPALEKWRKKFVLDLFQQ
jgi:hypothetical protein